MTADVLSLLEEMKQRMIDGTPMDVSIAFAVEECIQALKAAGSGRTVVPPTYPSQPRPQYPPSQTGAPPTPGDILCTASTEHTRYVADSVEELNSVIRDEPIPEEQDRPTLGGAIAGAAERIGGILRRE